MRNTLLARFLSLMLSGMLALAPLPLMAGVYKCEHGGQVIYSDAPCGKTGQAMKAGVTVVPAFAPPARPSSNIRDFLDSLGLGGTSAVIAALLFGIPVSFLVIFFLTRKSER
ncbi:MAG TPA: DUF4124 domain-containing protein [Gallionellaceae bacterium]|nr:DUF4124 domain-containing protein [Gallionellaceae bacterium]